MLEDICWVVAEHSSCCCPNDLAQQQEEETHQRLGVGVGVGVGMEVPVQELQQDHIDLQLPTSFKVIHH